MRNVIIIGGGPAGMTAAIYTARANMDPLCLIGESDESRGLSPGGQLMITSDVENYPGFPEGITGPEMMADFQKQAERFGAEIVQKFVAKVDFSRRPFTVEYDGRTEEAKTVIIATGASARWLGLESERALRGRGVSACATCDGFFFREKEVAVIGGGDSAMEEALFLTRFATKVHIIHRRDELRASKIMGQRAKDHPKIEIVWDSVVEEALGVEEEKLRAVRLKNVKTGETSELAVEGLFVALGHTPNVDVFAGQIETDDKGFIAVQRPTTQTSVEGVFACGDVMDSRYKQAVTAAGTGCAAAIDAERWLEAQEG
jgi:thioredoxin reductase (NADPH)